MQEKIKEIKDLKKNEIKALNAMVQPKTIPEIAAILGYAYATTAQKLMIWSAREWIIKIPAVSQFHRIHYKLNQNHGELNAYLLSKEEKMLEIENA